MVKAYSECYKKLGLPSEEDLSKIFDIKQLEEGFTLSNVRKEICDKLFEISKELEDIIYPESTPACMHEGSDINEKTRNSALKCYKKLRLLFRFGQAISFSDNEDSENANYIKKCFDAFKDMKKDLSFIFSELMETWEKNSFKGKKENYFG